MGRETVGGGIAGFLVLLANAMNPNAFFSPPPISAFVHGIGIGIGIWAIAVAVHDRLLRST